MCGIAGVYLLDDSLKVNLDALLDTMLDEIEHRGGDATGYVAFGDDGVLEWQKAACGAKDFGKYRRPVPEGTRTILAHTRWATQGLPAFAENNHPLKRGSFFAIHNGHVSNDHELFQLAGRERYGQVDSESIPARLASLGKLDGLKIVMEEIHGAAAVAAVDSERPRDLALARGHSSPLFVLRTKKIVLFGSTLHSVKAAYEEHIGAIPKRTKIEAQKEGTFLLFRDGKVKQSKFKPYSPPKVVRKYTMPNVTLPYEEVTFSAPKELAASTGWDSEKDSDTLDCDCCGATVSWTDMEYVQDTELGLTAQLCPVCFMWEDEDDRARGRSVLGKVADDFAAANEAALSNFLSEGEDD